MELLTPALQRYDWGSTVDIPKFLGIAGDGGPVAEAWWGTHPAAPARISSPNSGQTGLTEAERSADLEPSLDENYAENTLTEAIARQAETLLGKEVHDAWGELPYLLKVLGIAKPLSIQVHPNAAQAAAGFAAENEAGVPLSAAGRIFKDPSHKPELVYALSPTRILAGWRPLAETAAELASWGTPAAAELAQIIRDAGVAQYVETVLTAPVGRVALTELAAVSVSTPHTENAQAALAHHPGDLGALVTLAMNLLTLTPGEVCYVGAGVVHSYQAGFALEIMANSDNVIRAGLTPKVVDVPMLLDTADWEIGPPHRPAPLRSADTETYVTPAAEFVLQIVTHGATTVRRGPRIVLALSEVAQVATRVGQVDLLPGQAVFVGDDEGPMAVVSKGKAAIAGVANHTN